MTEYEVKCPQTWAWYTGYVENYDIEKKKLLITYDNDWKQSEWVDVESVRDKFDLSLRENWRPSENEEVECKARAEEGEPYGWWPCTAKKFISNKSSSSSSSSSQQDQLFSVSFNGWGDAHNELLSLSFIRPKSQSKILSSRNMHREEYDVPDQLKLWVDELNTNNTLLDTLMPQKKISQQIVHIDYLTDKNKILLIGNKRVLITMKDIIYVHFKRQETIAKLEKKTKDLEQKSREKKEQELNAEKYTFNIHPLLSGYLRGRKGININNIHKKFQGQGLLKIEPGLQTCCVLAKTKSTLKKAVDELQIVCKKVIIPWEEMGQIIGAKGQQIQDIKLKSHVIKIISWEKWPDEFYQLHEGQKNYYRDEAWQNDENRDEHTDDYPYYDKYVPDIILNTDENNIFGKDDIIDLSIGYESQYVNTSSSTQINTNELSIDNNQIEEDQNDALVIIGRKSRVDLCIFMIEMTLNHFRTITKTKKNVFLLRTKINEIKGNPPPQAYTPRDRNRRNRRDRGRGRGNRDRYNNNDQEQGDFDETKESSPKQNFDDGGDGNYSKGGYRTRGGNKSGRGRGRGRGNRDNRDRGYNQGNKYNQGRGGRRGYNQNRQNSGARQYQRKGQGNYNGYNQSGGGGGGGNYEQQYDDYGGDGNYEQYDNNQENNNHNNQRGQGGDGGGNKQQNKGKKKRGGARRNKKKNNNNDDGGNKQQNQNQSQTEQPSTS